MQDRRRRPSSERDHTAGDRGHRDDIRRGDALSETASAGAEQPDETDRERRLDNRQRREQQRGGMQRPARDAEDRAREPAAPAREPRDQSRAPGMTDRGGARLQRLQGDAGVVDERRDRRGQRTQDGD